MDVDVDIKNETIETNNVPMDVDVDGKITRYLHLGPKEHHPCQPKKGLGRPWDPSRNLRGAVPIKKTEVQPSNCIFNRKPEDIFGTIMALGFLW